jgi:hypothetical protein
LFTPWGDQVCSSRQRLFFFTVSHCGGCHILLIYYLKYYNSFFVILFILVKGDVSINNLKAHSQLSAHEELITELIDLLTVILNDNLGGITEHELLKLLQQAPYEFFSEDALRDPLILFQTHFLLFHCLYTLKQRWRLSQQSELEISALNIIKRPYYLQQVEGISIQPLAETDSLAQYYLDWSHFSNTGNEEVEELLNSFWRKVFTPQDDESIKLSLTIMELDSPIPTIELKVQYRRLAQLHHPDKGGDSEHFKKICQAFQQLKQYNLLSN